VLSIPELHPVLNDLFHDDAEYLARLSGFCRRARKLTGPAFAQTLTFALLENPDATLEDFADFAEDVLGVDVTPQAFDKRFNPQAAEFLLELLRQAFNRSFSSLRPTLLPVLRRFTAVFLRDATLVTLPASLADLFPGRGGRHAPHGRAAAVKLVFEAEVTSGELTDLSLLAGRDNEKVAAVADKPLPAGALLLEDMGFFCGQRLQRCADQEAYFLTRIPAWTAVFDLKGRRLDLVRLLRKTNADRLERKVRILHDCRMEVRLLAVRLPEEEANERRQRVRQEAKQRGRKVSQKKLELCDWNILVTNASAELLDVESAWVVRRVRWQVELVFKVFKSGGGVDRTRSECPWRVQCELYAKLLGMVVQQWLLLSAGYVMLRHSAYRAARQVRRLARRVVEGLGRVEVLVRAVIRLAHAVHRRCRVVPRESEPSTLDRLTELDPDYEPREGAAREEVSGAA
jgi:hypothetical protein